jgi:hypothetical protein
VVIALFDHFTQKPLNSNGPQPSGRVETNNNTASSALSQTPVDDIWALEHTTTNGNQALMEALDHDGTSFVTVDEVNTFSSSRPEGWRRVSGQGVSFLSDSPSQPCPLDCILVRWI